MKPHLLLCLLFTTATFASEMVSKSISVNTWISTDLSNMGMRSTADVEQFADEVPGFMLDFDAGEVATVADIRQPTVRELFNRILQDEAQMNVWRAESPGASDLEILRANLAP